MRFITSRPRRRAALALVPLLLTAGSRPPSVSPPALVVLFVVDQMRPDYFTRFGGQFTGGLARLRRRGAFYPNGLQDHAITQTAPGHATILSGRTPASTGILSNDRGVPDAASPVLGAPGASGASPRLFRGSTLYDWMLARDSGARVLAVSRKDRGAILPVGRARGDVYWFVDGRFTTSSYYADTLSDWVRAYDARNGPARLAGRTWSTLLPPDAYPEADSLAFENHGVDIAFPHVLPTAPDSLTARLRRYPWMDSLTLDFALEGARRTGLGRRREGTDLLVVSLSTTDEIGHDWGPDSREMHDQLLRLDHWMGWFLDSLGALVPAERTVIALTADHGILPAPDYARDVLHQPGGRAWLGDIAATAERAFGARYHRSFAFRFEYGLLTADVAELAAIGVNVDSLARALAAVARGRPGISRAYTPATLAAAPPGDVMAARWRRSIVPGLGWLFAAVTAPGVIWSRNGVANHGTPQEGDVRVPIIVYGPGVHAGTFPRRVPTEDIAPTLARLIGVTPTQPITGHPLKEVFAR